MKIRLFVLLLCTHILALASPDFTRFAFTLEVKEGNEISHNGTGCFVKSGGSVYYVTAHHIFSDMTDAQRAAMVKSLTIVSESNRHLRFAPEQFVPVAQAQDLTKTDMMVFKMKPNPSLSAYTVVLAPSAPLKDETVYLASRLPGHPAATYALKILDLDNERVSYEKIAGIEKYTGASGGPILNEKGQLVGTYLGRVFTDSKRTDIRCLFGTPHPSLTNILPTPK